MTQKVEYAYPHTVRTPNWPYDILVALHWAIYVLMVWQNVKQL